MRFSSCCFFILLFILWRLRTFSMIALISDLTRVSGKPFQPGVTFYLYGGRDSGWLCGLLIFCLRDLGGDQIHG